MLPFPPLRYRSYFLSCLLLSCTNTGHTSGKYYSSPGRKRCRKFVKDEITNTTVKNYTGIFLKKRTRVLPSFRKMLLTRRPVDQSHVSDSPRKPLPHPLPRRHNHPWSKPGTVATPPERWRPSPRRYLEKYEIKKRRKKRRHPAKLTFDMAPPIGWSARCRLIHS